MKLPDILTSLLATKPGANMSDLARACGVTPQAVQQWISGTTAPRANSRMKIAEYFGISYPALSVLELGAGGMDDLEVLLKDGNPNVLQVIKYQASRKRSHFVPTGAPGPKTVPAIQHTLDFRALDASAPTPISMLKIPETEAYGMFGPRDFSQVSFTFINDDTMAPTLNPGDLVFIDESYAAQGSIAEDGVYLVEHEGKWHVKRLQKMAGRLAVKTDNSLYDTWFIEAADMRKLKVIGRVIRAMSIGMRVLG